MNKIFIATLLSLTLLTACSSGTTDGMQNNVNLNSPEQTTSPGDSNN